MFPYENLEVYKKAFSANQRIFRFLKGNKTIPGYAKDQLGRASLSTLKYTQRYTHIAEELKRNAVNNLPEIIL
jgi:hypothetical protein